MQDNFLVTTTALLGLSVYMGVAFKDIAVIKMIKGRTADLAHHVITLNIVPVSLIWKVKGLQRRLGSSTKPNSKQEC